jgi:SAM-dependent methyltransferase
LAKRVLEALSARHDEGVVNEADPRDAKLAVYGDPEHARRYATRWDGGRGRARDVRKQRALAVALEHLGAFRTVLDVPCGTGRMTDFLRERRSYVGADLAAAMLGEARARHPDAAYVVADLARLPFADASFDVAVCVRLLHLVRDRGLRVAFLAELARVARLGVVVDFRHDRAVRTWLGRARARVGLRARAHNAHSRASVTAELAAAGLRDVRFVGVRRPAVLSDKMVAVARVDALPRNTPGAL